MIYVKPLGGLCNRLRTIDSWITLCKSYRKDLTILWVMDSSLNSSFKDLYAIPEFVEFKFVILDCPPGFPENFTYNGVFDRRTPNSFGDYYKSVVRFLKNALRGRYLKTEHKIIRNIILKLNKVDTLNDNLLTNIYASNEQTDDATIDEMDQTFFLKVEKLVGLLLSKPDAYISSCYRVSAIANAYSSFVPKRQIQDKVIATTTKFESTYGLHIRRSDHKTSKHFSTTEKFTNLIEVILAENPVTTFFLSTDDEITKYNLLKTFGNSIIVNEVESYDRNNSNGVHDAMVDLYCLAKTKKIYGSHHSSFSQTAAHIGEIELVTVK